MLADAIADVRKQNELLAASGQKGVPVWKQLGKALLSPQTALIALISLGIVYGKEIGQWIKKTLSFSNSLETLSESQERYQEALSKGNAEAQNSITRLRVLYNAATDEAESTETRKKAIVALKRNIRIISARCLTKILCWVSRQMPMNVLLFPYWQRHVPVHL